MLCFKPDCSRCSGWCRKSTGLAGFGGFLPFFFCCCRFVLRLSLWISLSQSFLHLPVVSSAPIAGTVCSVTAWAIPRRSSPEPSPSWQSPETAFSHFMFQL